MKIAILTTKDQWFDPYAGVLSNKLGNVPIFNNHDDFNDKYNVIFIISYHNIIPQEALERNNHNIVIHESLLSKGKGWSPLCWQIIDGKNNIPFTMIEASDGIDNGDIYMKEVLELVGDELNEELRGKQAKLTIQMCLEFINNYEQYKIPVKHSCDDSFYSKRNGEDSDLDIDETIREQFNILKIVGKNDYPAYFELDGNRYILKIKLDKSGEVKLIDFVDLTLDEKLIVLNWRNSDNIKKWMYSQDKITIERHIDFINNLFFSKDRQYILIKKNNNYIGVINFSNICSDKKQSYFGLYSNPFNKIEGVGKILQEASIKYAFDLLKLEKINLEVFESNTRAINLYNKFNFRKISEKIVNRKKVNCLELQR